LVACGSNSVVHRADAGQSGAGDAGLAADAEEDFVGCPEITTPFAPGLQAMGKRFAVKLLEAMPAEPERHVNDWTVEVSALDGSPAPDAQIDRGETFMPLHGHTGGVVPKTMALSLPGQFQVDRLNFIMRGPWEVRLWLSSASLGDDYAVFQVCVAK
jgi:hypothetical protein